MAGTCNCKWMLALLLLALNGAALAAGGTYDEEDPFDEMRRFERFQQLGGDSKPSWRAARWVCCVFVLRSV